MGIAKLRIAVRTKGFYAHLSNTLAMRRLCVAIWTLDAYLGCLAAKFCPPTTRLILPAMTRGFGSIWLALPPVFRNCLRGISPMAPRTDNKEGYP